LLSDNFIQVPLTSDVQFKNKLESIILSETIGTYIPFIDNEIYLGALLYEEKFIEHDLKLQVKNSEIADICNDKYKTYQFLSENNILTPKCYLPHEAIMTNENLIVKPRKGFGSNVFMFSKVKENISQFDSDSYIIQQECEKQEITVDVCSDKASGFFFCICRERIEVKSGVCTKSRLFFDKNIENIAFIIAEKLCLSSFCFQLMKYKNEWAVTDINARFGAGTAMSVAAGMDFFSSMFTILWNQDPSIYFKPIKKETYVTRQYADFVMNI
jgi:carbamoylphosphate synthase large subunit